MLCETCGRRYDIETKSKERYFFSEREHSVVCLTYQGLRNKEIAERLFISEKTVKFHLTNIFKKVNVVSRGQLIRMAAEDKTLLDQFRPRVDKKNPNYPFKQNINGL